MTKYFSVLFAVAFLVVQGAPAARAGVLSKLFGDMFSGWGSKAASESTGQAAARRAARQSNQRRADHDSFAKRAGETALEQAAQDRFKEYSNTHTHDRQRDHHRGRLSPRRAR